MKRSRQPVREEQRGLYLTPRSPGGNANDKNSDKIASHENSAWTSAEEVLSRERAGYARHRSRPTHKLIQHLNLLRSEMLELEASGLVTHKDVHPGHRASARNLMHYLALRRHDIRPLQSQLASLGLSSLGRTESHVMSALNAVINLVSRLAGSGEVSGEASNGTPGFGEGAVLLDKNTEALLGTAPAGRTVRIMVTMPPEAATDYPLLRDLLLHGMDCMRINCAHDGPEAWSAMIGNLRRAEKETNKRCKIAMDVAGPKLRTGPVQPGPAVLKYRPKRDPLGRVASPARIWLTPSSAPEIPPDPSDAVLPVPQAWLRRLKTERLRTFHRRPWSRTHYDDYWSRGRQSVGRSSSNRVHRPRSCP